MSGGSIKKNMGYQTAYQLLNTCLPLITAPYLARVLGAEQLGVFSYTSANVSYFVLLAMMGFVTYGTRAVAAAGGDRGQRSRTFRQIYTLQLFCSACAAVLYAGYLLLAVRENRLICLIQGIEVLACFANVDWFFFGMEEFALTVKRNMVIRIATVTLILLLVKRPEDLWKYCLLMQGGVFLSHACLWPHLPARLEGRRGPDFDRKHIRPVIALFLPLLAMSVYHVMDKTMLGAISTDMQSGFYYNADKVINIPLGLLTGVGTVLLPRITALDSEGREQEATGLFLRSVEGLMAASCAIGMGIAAVAPEFVPVFFGRGYEPCVELIRVFCPVLIIKALSLAVRYEYLIPRGREACYTRSVVGGAAVNLALNMALIPRLGALGAVWGTLAAELAACLWQYISIRKEINCLPTIGKSLIYAVFGAVMWGAVRLTARVIPWGGLPALLCEIAAGAALFAGMCLLYWKGTGRNLLRQFLEEKNA